MIILITFGFSALLALLLGLALGFFKEKFNVEKDPLMAACETTLPGINCGACGYPGCGGYATALASGEAPVTKCAPGGKATAEALANLLGVSASAVDIVAVLACQGHKDAAQVKGDYVGVKTCRAAKLSAGGTKLCAWGCMGYGDCVAVCQFDAIKIQADGLPHVDYAKCTGCRFCILECPSQLLQAIPRDQVGSMVICSNRSVVKANVMKQCKVGCIKCGICVKSCPEECITMVNGIPVTDFEKCTSCGICVEKCPTKCYKLLQGITGATGELSPRPLLKEEPAIKIGCCN